MRWSGRGIFTRDSHKGSGPPPPEGSLAQGLGRKARVTTVGFGSGGRIERGSRGKGSLGLRPNYSALHTLEGLGRRGDYG